MLKALQQDGIAALIGKLVFVTMIQTTFKLSKTRLTQLAFTIRTLLNT